MSRSSIHLARFGRTIFAVLLPALATRRLWVGLVVAVLELVIRMRRVYKVFGVWPWAFVVDALLAIAWILAIFLLLDR